MKLSQIIKNLLIDTNLRSDKYTEQRRIEEVNQALNYYIEYATQIGWKFDFESSQDVNVYQDEDITTIDRDIKHSVVKRIEFLGEDGTDDPICLKAKKDCKGNNCSLSKNGTTTTFKTTDTAIELYDTQKGLYRVFYERMEIPVLTTSNLNDEINYFQDTFTPLLWLAPAMKNVGFYDPTKYKSLTNEYEKLHILFRNHHYRNSSFNRRVVFGNRKKTNRNNL